MKPTAASDTPLYNSRIIQTYVNLLKSRYPHVDVDQLLAWADMNRHQVADQWHWFTQEQANRFHDRLVTLTGNQDIAREAGRFAASTDAIGIVRHFVLGFLDPGRVYEHIGKTASKFTRSTRYECRRLGKRRVEITVTPYAGVREQPYQCHNRVGFLEAVVMIFCDNLPRVEQPECMFRGDPRCRYIITWHQGSLDLLKKMRKGLVAGALAAALPAFWFYSGQGLNSLPFIGMAALFGLWIFIDQREKTELRRNLDHLRASSDVLIDQIEHNYNNALLINTIAQNITGQVHVKNLVDSLLDSFRKHLDFDKTMIFLVDGENDRLFYAGGYGNKPGREKKLREKTIALKRDDAGHILTPPLDQLNPVLINDIQRNMAEHPALCQEFFKELGAHSIICCPIVHSGAALGLVLVGNDQTQRMLRSRDLSLVSGIAPVIGISLHNAELLQKRKAQFNTTLTALAATIDARDPMTAGHSERVTEFAMGICRQMNLAEDLCETIRAAALLHDYGKIAVPDAILKKPGRLSAHEYELVKRHAAHTREALENISFEGIYKDVPAIAGAHHEKIDGSGYPDGLNGPQIPLGAKIIAVADFFEAITAKRHYREPMPLCIAIQELKKKRNRHFAPEIVDAFLQYYEKEHLPKTGGLANFATYLGWDSLRVKCHIPLAIRHTNETVQASVTDLSTRGLFAATTMTAAEGSAVTLCFSLPQTTHPPLEVDGRVVWINHACLPRKALFPPGLGIAFTDMEQEQNERLRQFVYTRLDETEEPFAAALI